MVGPIQKTAKTLTKARKTITKYEINPFEKQLLKNRLFENKHVENMVIETRPLKQGNPGKIRTPRAYSSLAIAHSP